MICQNCKNSTSGYCDEHLNIAYPMTLQSYIQQRAEEFDKLPFGITRGVNIDVMGETQGIEISARDEVKAFYSETTTHVIEMFREMVGEIEETMSPEDVATLLFKDAGQGYKEIIKQGRMYERSRILSQLPNQKQS